MRRLGAERVSLGGERCTEPCLAHQQLDMQAVLLSGGYQILQRTAPPPHTHTLVWPSLMARALGPTETQAGTGKGPGCRPG